MSNIYAEVTKYLNSPISVVNLAQRNIETGGRNLQIASNYLETWDDSDNITVVTAQKRFETFTKMVA